jgi:hypothetical protein
MKHMGGEQKQKQEQGTSEKVVRHPKVNLQAKYRQKKYSM